MTLTHEDVQQLTAQFDASDHEEREGRTYIREGAITRRLDEVDPSWTWELLGQPVYRDGTVTVTGRLTVNGVWRDGVGMENIRTSKTGNEVNEAEKSAATDALKRAARLFGIGRYLLDLGKGQKPQPQTNRQQYQQRSQQTVNKTTGEISEDTTQFVSTKLIVKLTQKGKPFLIFPNVDEPNHYATDFTRDRLRKAGYNVDGWDKPGEYPLEPAALVSGAIDDSGYLNVTDLVQDMPM